MQDLRDWLPDDEDRARGAFAIAVKSLLTPEECQQLKQAAELVGYSSNLEQERGLRQGRRAMADDPALAARILERLTPFLPQTWDMANCSRGNVNTGLCQAQRGESFALAGINERFRFLSYGVGEYFNAHVDGYFVREVHGVPVTRCDRGVITVQMYLDGGYRGGSTRFLHPHCSHMRQQGFCPGEACPNGLCKDPPVGPGDAVVFQHDIWHQGSALLEGMKTACRTEVMYGPAGGAAVAPAGREWSCERCTFNNPGGGVCSMCAAPKPPADAGEKDGDGA